MSEQTPSTTDPDEGAEPQVAATQDVEPQAVPAPQPEPESAAAAEEDTQPEPDTAPDQEDTQPEPDTAPDQEDTQPEPESAAAAQPDASAAHQEDTLPEPPTPRPAAPRPAAPSPAMFAARRPAAPRPPRPTPPGGGAPSGESGTPAPAAPATPSTPSESMKHGRVADDGTVFVIAADGSEREVGSYPGAGAEEALAYFARKYDELAAGADLLRSRLAGTGVSSHDARQSLTHLKEQIGEAHVVGDIAALEATVAHLESEVKAKARLEQEERAVAKAQAGVEREKIVVEAEELAATDPAKIQWKQGSARVRELLDEWKAHQRSGPRLDKEVENALWQRFSHARSAFDKMRKSWFAQLDEEHGAARSTKERLVREAEALSSSKDWGATAGAFKRLMQEWKRAGRASRADDDALWARFKAAQDSFFDAKDEVVAAEEAEYAENLTVKEALLVEAEAISVDERHLDQAKAELRKIQDRWDEAGKVPRGDIKRVENRLRAVEQKVRDIEDKQWQRSDPELNARARSMVDQLERAVQGLEADLAAAQASGEDKKAKDLESELATKKLWLDSARGGLG